MPPDLHVRPDRLHEHAVTARGLSEDLRTLATAPWPPGAEHLRAPMRDARRELDALSAALSGVATAAEVADDDAARSFGRPGGHR